MLLLAAIFTLFNECTKSDLKQIAGSAIAYGADTEVKYDANACRILRQQCVQGDFQEWETSDKEMGCSCKKL